MKPKFNPEENTAKYYDLIYQDWMNEPLTKEELRLIQSLVKKGGRILDIGCGTGRHSGPLAHKGFQVVGVECLKNFASKLKKNYPKIKVVNDYFLPAKISGSFDLIISMWNTFTQLAHTENEAIKVLRKIHKLLSPDGHVIIGNSSGESDRKKGLNFTYTKTVGGKKYKLVWKVQSWDRKTNITVCTEHIQVFDKAGKLLEEACATIKQRWWRPAEITTLTKKAGFDVKIRNLKNGTDLYYILTKQ